MRIGELSRRTSVSTRLLRYYEEQGLLVPARLSNGYRDYADDATMTVGQIRGLLDAGLSTDVIREVLPCAEGNEPRLNACPKLLATLREAFEGIQARIDHLTHHRDALLRFLDAAEPTTAGQTPSTRACIDTRAAGQAVRPPRYDPIQEPVT
jgi:DNA-binding transcriptional MerR regulator